MQLQEKAGLKAFVLSPFTCPQESSSQGCVRHLSILPKNNYSSIILGNLYFTQGLLN